MRLLLVSLLTMVGICMSPILADSKQNRECVLSLCTQIEEQLSQCSTLEEKTEQLQQDLSVINSLQKYPEVSQFLSTANSEQTYVLALTAALKQFDTVFEGFEHHPNKQAAISKLTSILVEVDQFYESIGGLLGYHKTFVSLFDKPSEPTADVSVPPYIDIKTPTTTLWKLCFEGCKNLDKTAFIFPVGGAGDRLGLINKETGEPLPTACQTFCGRSLFEGLMRDALAQEYWHYRAFGKKLQIPIVVMTSQEKNNTHYIEQMCSDAQWFGRSKDKVRSIVQPLVPLIDLDGNWVIRSPLELALKPGGHGIIWKLSQDSGAFHWLKRQHVEHALIRQINNPLAALDYSLFALGGYGSTHNKSLGFLSCPSRPGMAEGLNVLAVQDNKATISNIEYTHFTSLKEKMPHLFKEGIFPANTNVIYANIQSIEKALLSDPFPGMVINAKTKITREKEGETIQTQAGRIESSMQNMSDVLLAPINLSDPSKITPEHLSTFLLLQKRDKFFSALKNSFVPGQKSIETPHAALYDWNNSLYSLLENECHFTLAKRQTLDEFLSNGPILSFNFHPALGPLWSVISQKLSHGSITEGSELELEIAEISCHNLLLDGSLRILAKTPLGKAEDQSSFDPKVGRARLNNFTVTNKGLSERSADSALHANFEREESCTIVLEGFSEVEADNITVDGPFHLVVPDGQKAILTQEESGEITTTFEPISQPSWQYTVEWNPDSAPKLEIVEAVL